MSVASGMRAVNRRCQDRRAAREARERGETAPPHALEVPLYRPFALLASVVTLGVATPVGAFALFRLYAPAGHVPAIWLPIHAHLQIFGFAGVLIMGVSQHLLLRFSHAPIRSPRCMPWILGSIALGLLARLAAVLFPNTSLWAASGMAEFLAYALFAVWVTACVRAAEPRFASDWLMVTGAWWFAAATGAELASMVWAVAIGANPTTGFPGPGSYTMSLYGGVFGWVLGVALRVAPMFLAGRNPTWMGGASLISLNGAVILDLLAEAWPAATRPAQLFQAFADLGVAAALIAAAVAVGAWRHAPRHTLALHLDRTEAWFFRLAFASAGLAAIGLILAAILAMAGTPRGLLVDATRHLLTVGFVIGMICAMGFRFMPVIEGVPLPLPWLRIVGFWTLAAGTILRTMEVGADYLHENFLRPAAVSGFLVWLALGCWTLAASLTMLGGIRARRVGRAVPSLPAPPA